jgi:hypothetical protein
MTLTRITHRLSALLLTLGLTLGLTLAALVLSSPSYSASPGSSPSGTPGRSSVEFAAARPAARVEYWQQRQAEIGVQLADADSLRAWPQNRPLNFAVSSDRTEHHLYWLLPKSQGGLGLLDAEALTPEFMVLMVGLSISYAAEQPVADSVLAGAGSHARHSRAQAPCAAAAIDVAGL